MAFPLEAPSHDEDAWHTLVHVCQRWRRVAFDSPRRLNLTLLCKNKRLLNTLDIWPELPIVICVDDWECHQPPPSVTDVVSVLKRHDRVFKILIDDVPNSLLEELAMGNELFPALIELDLVSFKGDPPILSDSFLGGSAPRLQSFSLWGIPFPAIGKLILSARDLVTISLGLVPPSGLMLPEAMVDILSTLTKLKTLRLNFLCFEPPEVWTHATRQCPPTPTRVVLPALTDFYFYGNSKYLEGIVSRIDAPLDCIVVIFTNQLIVSDIPSFRDFIHRTKIRNGSHRADTFFSNVNVEISLFQRKGDIDSKALTLRIPCSWYEEDSQLSSLAQACSTLLPPLPSLEQLGLYNSKFPPSQWQDEDNTRWMELLLFFTTVKDLVLDEPIVLSVASSLQELVGERVAKISPALQNIYLEGFQSLGPVPEAIAKFIAARELSGHPVFVHRRELKQ